MVLQRSVVGRQAGHRDVGAVGTKARLGTGFHAGREEAEQGRLPGAKIRCEGNKRQGEDPASSDQQVICKNEKAEPSVRSRCREWLGERLRANYVRLRPGSSQHLDSDLTLNFDPSQETAYMR